MADAKKRKSNEARLRAGMAQTPVGLAKRSGPSGTVGGAARQSGSFVEMWPQDLANLQVSLLVDACASRLHEVGAV